MKILHFSQYYYPESTAGAFGAYDNTKTWARMGSDVTVFTAYPNHPKGKIYDGYNNKLISNEVIDGVKVIRSKLIIKESKSYLNKLINTLSFFFFGIINFLINNRKIGKGFDVVTAADGPIFSTLLGYLYATIHRIPFVFEIRDLTWLQLIALGKPVNAISVVFLKKIELRLSKKANRIIAITQGFKDVLVNEGIDEKKIHVITNGVDADGLSKRVYEKKDEPFVMGYYGVLGLTQNVTKTFPYADEIIKHVPRLKYLIIGEGAHRNKIAETIKERKDDSIELLPGMSPKELEKYYLETTFGVATLEKSEQFKYTIPSKVFQIMARGVAVMFIGPDGEAANIIEKNNAGIILTGGIEEDLRKLDDFFGDQNWYEKIRIMGGNAYRTIRDNYSRTMLAEKYYSILMEISNEKKR